MTPAGEQLCYSDAYLRSVEARVASVESGDATLLVLDRTVFYPGGGGQPSDRGLVLRASDGRSWTVRAARKAGGEIVHELFGAAVTSVIPGVREVHAVDEAGVHPLLLAIGSERYAPYLATARPMELLTQANAILGQGQLSLAKYLFIVDGAGAPSLRASELRAFFTHALERVDPARDLHFQTNTTIDTLDYSGSALNEGSKVVIAACGEPKRALGAAVPSSLALPGGYGEPSVVLPGVLAISAPAYEPGSAERFCESFADGAIEGFPLVVLVDDAPFTARTMANFVWVTFTRSDPARHVHGVGAFVRDKAWGCRGSIVIDARMKPGHAPALEEDPAVTRRGESCAVRGGPLSGLFR